MRNFRSRKGLAVITISPFCALRRCFVLNRVQATKREANPCHYIIIFRIVFESSNDVQSFVTFKVEAFLFEKIE